MRERNLKEASQNKWLVLLESSRSSHFVNQLLDTFYGAGLRFELIVELTILLHSGSVAAGFASCLALVSIAPGQRLAMES